MAAEPADRRRPAAAGQPRVGLFGGSFDPVHVAHVALARAALERLDLRQVRWIPVGTAWQKDPADAGPADREAMVRLAIDGEPRFVVDRSELRRKGPSYTLDTVREQVAAEPGTRFVLLLGQDQYASIHTWRDWRELLSLVEVGVADRPDVHAVASPQVTAFPHVLTRLQLDCDVSSTEIRRRLATGESIAGMVPDGVARYIAQRGLYGPDPQADTGS